MVAYDAGFWTQDIPVVTVNGGMLNTEIITGDDQGGDGDDWHNGPLSMRCLQAPVPSAFPFPTRSVLSPAR